MNRTATWVLVMAVILLGSMVSEAQAQRTSRYQNRSVSRPSAMSYFNMGSGYGLGGYGMVDPLLATYLQRNQNAASRRRENQTPTMPGFSSNPMVDRARAARQTPLGTALPTGQAAVAPTGTGSVFMQYSHYFQVPAGRRR